MSDTIKITPDKKILFLTKNLKLIEDQLYHGLRLTFNDLSPDDLLDDINTDVMTPAWVCFSHDPKEIAQLAYAGLFYEGRRVFLNNSLKNGGFFALVSGYGKGTGSSRETAAQCERYAGVRYIFARSFAPIHARNNINLGQKMGDLALLKRLLSGEEISLKEFVAPLDELSAKIVVSGGLFSFLKNSLPNNPKPSPVEEIKPLTMAQKIMAKKQQTPHLEKILRQESDVFFVDKGYSHEFTTAQVHQFLRHEYGDDYTVKNAANFAAFEDHLIYTDTVQRYAPFKQKIAELRALQKSFIEKNGIQDFSAIDGISPGICHEVARERMILPGDFVQATDSHTCMGGALNAFACGVGATEYAAILKMGLSISQVPFSINFELLGMLKPYATAKDVMLHILKEYTTKGLTLNRVMEFTGPGLLALNIDERATLCNMATECQAKTGIALPDEKLTAYLIDKHPHLTKEDIESRFSFPDRDAPYERTITIDLNLIEPMVAHPGNPDLGQPSDPTNGALVSEIGKVPIDIAYGGSCTAGKAHDIDMYAQVVNFYAKRGVSLAKHVQFFIQYGSSSVRDYAIKQGHDRLFKQVGIKVIPPGCGACIGCGPGVSERPEQITVSAINRNFQGRSGPGKLYLASPLTVAASAFKGYISAFNALD